MNIAVEELLALLIMQQEGDGGTFIPREDLEKDLSGLSIGLDWDMVRDGVVLFMIEKEDILYDEED